MVATKEFIKNKVNELIKEHLSKYNRKWQFKFNKSKKSLGRCQVFRYENKGFIFISEYMIGVSKENVLNTILHEIAHALDYERNGNLSHGYTWQKIMRELGLEPLRLATKNESLEFSQNIDYKYSGQCPICKSTFNKNRMSAEAKRNLNSTYYCIRCNQNTTKENRIYIQYKQNY